MTFYVISGRSGSGKSTMLHALEDGGYNCIDNFPASLLELLVQNERRAQRSENIAVCIDVRNAPEDLRALPDVLRAIDTAGVRPIVIYLDAQSSVLVKRFSDTRRRHPLDDTRVDLREAIDAETQVLAHIAELADLKLDTTQLSIHDLVQETNERLLDRQANSLALLFRSFAYRSGVPVDTDLLFDARCLPNPYWQEELREFTGRDRPVKAYLDESDVVDQFFNDIRNYLEGWLPKFATQNRVYMTVAVGCTGGKHRSVYVAERLGAHFAATYPDTMIRHRELPT